MTSFEIGTHIRGSAQVLKVAFVAPPRTYVSSSGKTVNAEDVDLLVRALSMGKLHHAMMGTCAVAIGTAAAIPGTLVNLAAGGGEPTDAQGHGPRLAFSCEGSSAGLRPRRQRSFA